MIIILPSGIDEGPSVGFLPAASESVNSPGNLDRCKSEDATTLRSKKGTCLVEETDKADWVRCRAVAVVQAREMRNMRSAVKVTMLSGRRWRLVPIHVLKYSLVGAVDVDTVPARGHVNTRLNSSLSRAER